MKNLTTALDARRQNGLYRRRRIVEGPQAPLMRIDGREVVTFCSNDYLGLAAHPLIGAAFKKGVDTYGVGAGAAHLINGHSRAHHALEQELAAFTGRERALLFSSGYMANLGVAAALIGRGDAVFEDRLNHASLLDAGLLSGARFHRYAHADVAALEKKLTACKQSERLIMTDGVFSMDGDVAPLRELAALAQAHQAWFMVDDAHGIGVLGEHGGGLVQREGLGQDEVPILMGTLGKAFGVSGAFVAGSQDMIETLIQSARSYVYTTASPPALAEAVRASLKLVIEEGWRRQRLADRVQRFVRGATQLGLPLMDAPSAIQPLLIGEAEATLQLSDALLEAGFLVTAIRPPTVAVGTSRLRVTLSAAHTEAQVDALLDVLGRLYSAQVQA